MDLVCKYSEKAFLLQALLDVASKRAFFIGVVVFAS